MWYQTGPYKAYYYTGRYQDVIDLANSTLDTVSDKSLEESIYWRGMAELALGDNASAVEDFRRAVYLNSSFTPGIEALNNLGVQP
jgi:tetratricopeptide (TPR) repeat protein